MVPGEGAFLAARRDVPVFAEHYKKLDDPAKAEEVRQAVADWKREAAPHTWDK